MLVVTIATTALMKLNKHVTLKPCLSIVIWKEIVTTHWNRWHVKLSKAWWENPQNLRFHFYSSKYLRRKWWVSSPSLPFPIRIYKTLPEKISSMFFSSSPIKPLAFQKLLVPKEFLMLHSELLTASAPLHMLDSPSLDFCPQGCF